MRNHIDDGTEIRVLLIEDHDKVRAAVRAILESADGIQVVGDAAEGQQAAELAGREHPDVLVLDLDVAMLNGDMTVGSMLSEFPDMHVLLMSSYDDIEYARGFVDQGAAGCVLKDDVPEALAQAVRAVQHDPDRVWISPRLQAHTPGASDEGGTEPRGQTA